MKLAVGTVQFGLDYGVSNNRGRVPDDEIREIATIARKSNITMVDTAIDYGGSESALGRSWLEGFDIVTKIGSVDRSIPDIASWIHDQIQGSLNRLNTKSLYGVLLHKPADLLGKNGRLIYDALFELKTQGYLQNIGISIYDPAELDHLIPRFDFDIVQAPMNLFDRRLCESGWLEKLKELDTQVHIRSVFLQGLLLMEPSTRPDYFNSWSSEFSKYDHWLSASNYSALEACLGFIAQNELVDKMIVGIASAEQLVEVVNAMAKEFVETPTGMAIGDQNLIDPSWWGI